MFTNEMNGPRIVQVKYEKKACVVSNATVMDFGAVGDGLTDDTIAFQNAIQYMESQGGGTLFIPEGRYVIKSPLNIPVGIALRGESPNAFENSAVRGTVLYAYVGKGSTDLYQDTAFITLFEDAGLRDVSIYYPEQTLTDGKAIPYSWTIRMQTGSTVENVQLVNSYKGIHIGPRGNIVTTVRDVCGTPLSYGMYIDCNTDIARFENVDFRADYWLDSGLGEVPNREALCSWLIGEATAFLYERTDWTYFWNLSFDGYMTGLHSRRSSGPSAPIVGKSGGQIYHAVITNCHICMNIEDATAYGGYLTNSTLLANGGDNPVAVKFGSNFTSSYMFNGCSIESTGNNVISNAGIGAVVLTNCSVIGGENAEALVDIMNKSRFSSTTTEYIGGTYHLRLAADVIAANLVNNMTAASFKVNDETDGSVVKVVYDDSLALVKVMEPQSYDVTYVTKPAKMQLLDVSKPPYNIVPLGDGVDADISAVLQKALDDMAMVGGGIVYVPAGEYYLNQSVTVPAGVELRGASDGMIHIGCNVTIFRTRYGCKNPSAEPLIVLSEKSGVYGFAVFHEIQSIVRNHAYFPYVIQGRGNDCYVVNVMLPNAYQGVDFATYRCDRHFLMGIYGCTLKSGIIVGGGSCHGVMRDCHLHAYAWIGTCFSPGKELGLPYGAMMDNILLPTLLGASDAMIVEETVCELLYSNFVYGAWHGFILRQGADVYMLGNGADGVGLALQIEDVVSDKTQWIVASQWCVHGGINNEMYIKVTEDFEGEANILQTLAFGHSPTAVELHGTGTVNMVNLCVPHVWQGSSKTQCTVNIRNALIAACYFMHDAPPNDIVITNGIETAVLYGSLFVTEKNPNIVNESGGNVSGGDIKWYALS